MRAISHSCPSPPHTARLSVVVSARLPALEPAAMALAEQLALGFYPWSEATLLADSCLMVTPVGLELCHARYPREGGVRVDFSAYLVRLGNSNHRPLLLKAIALKGNPTPTVLDATAGLGQDSLVLAQNHCTVLLLERSRIIAALLQDGWQRGLNQAQLVPVLQRMTLLPTNALTYMNPLTCPAPQEVVYLDPMYPQSRGAGLASKELRRLREIVGNDPDAEELLASALNFACYRVVVKRPEGGPPIPGPRPDFSLRSKLIRYDIYLTKK